MRKSKINKNQLKIITYNVINLMKNLNNSLKIETPEEALNFSLKINGYKNLNEIKNNEDIKFSFIDKNYFIFEKDKFEKDKIFLKSGDKNYIISNRKKLEKEEFKLIKLKSDVIKNDVIINLEILDTLIYGENSKFISEFKRELIEEEECVIYFGINDDYNYTKINPLKSIIESKYCENLFKINDSKSFSFIWLMLIRSLFEKEIVLSINELINFTKLNFLVNYYHNISENNIFKKSLEKYLENKFEVHENEYYITEEIQENHYEENKYLINKLYEIKELYDKNLFSYNEKSLEYYIKKKENINIYIEEDDLYKDLVLIDLNHNMFQHKKSHYKENVEYHYFLIFDEVEKFINEKWLKEIRDNSECNHNIFYLKDNSENKECFFEVNQIVFTQNNNIQLGEYIKNEILNYTEYYEENIFYNNYEEFRKLDDLDCFVWKPVSGNKDILNRYEIIKGTIKNN